MATEAQNNAVRLDKWLWAARFFKTRALAAQAVAGGKVKLNGERAKAAKAIRLNDRLSIQIGPYEHQVVVQGLSVRRGPAAQAVRLYEESAESRTARQALAARLSAEGRATPRATGRPGKKDRRALIHFKKARGG